MRYTCPTFLEITDSLLKLFIWINKTLCVLILNVIDNNLGCNYGDYDTSPILQEIFSLKMGCTNSV